MALQSSAYNRESFVNSTTTALSSGATFTGVWEECLGAESVVVSVKSDVSGTMYLQFSPDKTNVDGSDHYQIVAGISDTHRVSVSRKYFRLVITNGSTNQSYLRVQTLYGSQTALTSPLNSVIAQDADAIVTRGIDSEVAVAHGLLYGYQLVNKFGENADVDAAEDIWDGGGNYTGFPTTGSAETVTLISSSASDTSNGTGMRTATVFGLDGNYNQVQETVTLNGTLGATTTQTFWRVHRITGITAGSSGTNVGTITTRHTTTTANVFSVMPIGAGQSRSTAFTIPSGYTGYLNSYNGILFDNTANRASIALWIRRFEGCVILPITFVASTQFNSTLQIYGGVPIPEKADVIFRATAVQNANADIEVSYGMVLVLD